MVQYFYSQIRGTLPLVFLVFVLLPITLLGEELAVTREPGVRVKMRDGISLVADIYRPQGSGKYPVLLQRTPYNRQGDAQTAQSLASHGYAVILQDNRGRFDSEGIFYPFHYESQDGYDTVAGDGLLSEQEPNGQQPDTFIYDPLQAVPTLGGQLCCSAVVPGGPFDQRANEGRPDVLVFSTTPMEKDMEVTGFIKVELHASTSAVDTDFTALLADVSPNGYARYLADGVVRARYRNSTNKAEALVPGQIYKYNIDLWATSNVFKAGHKIRLYISSSNFPRFNRNLNTGEPTLKATHLVKANQTIYHDGAHPLALLLPTIPR